MLSAMITVHDIQEARQRLGDVPHRTPLLRSAALSDRSGREVLLKAENLQRIGAFKIRGAYNKIASLPDDVRTRGVVAHSSGNHAQGTALASKLLGLAATIVMPHSSSPVKIEGTKGYGAAVVLCEDSSDDRVRVARTIMDETGATLVPPFDDDHIIAGQGTVGLEIMEDAPDIDVLVVPVGGGGLIAGCAIAAKHANPKIRVIGVETEPANDAQRSFRTGKIVKIDPPDTIADGMRTQAIGARNFEIMQKFVDDIVTVTDEEVRETMKFLLLRMKTLAEPTGAVAPAAVYHRKLGRMPGQVCAIISGGNVDPSFISSLLA
jgi:threonine dehydratase